MATTSVPPIPSRFFQTPDENLDYKFNFIDWLTREGDTIDTFEFKADDGISVGDSYDLDGAVYVFLSGGEDGEKYNVTCIITTVGTTGTPRRKARRMVLNIKA